MKSMIRFLFSIYLWSTIGLATLGVTTLILCALPLALFDPSRRLADRLGEIWAGILLGLNPFWRLEITGRAHLHRHETYVLVSNHASLADIVCLFRLHHPFKWIAKKSLFRVPFLGWAMWAMGYVALERGRHGSIRTSYQKAKEWLGRNVSVVFFPEGTRSRTGEMGKFKSGAFRLAIETGRPVLPIVLAGTQKIISKGKSSFGKPGVAFLSILPAIETARMGPQDDEKLCQRVRSLMLEELQKRDRVLERL